MPSVRSVALGLWVRTGSRDEAPPQAGLAEAIFGDHPLGRRVLGSAEVISSVPIGDIRAYHDARYTAPHVVVAAAGHLDHERIVALAEQELPLAAGEQPAGSTGDAV